MNMDSRLKIFRPGNEEGFELAQPVADDDFALLHSLIDGTPREGSWTPIPMKVISKERRRSLSRSDSPWLLDDMLILRSQAAEALKPFLLNHGELLPLHCEQAELVVFNALRVVDALDEAASTLTRFRSGRIMLVDRHVFRKQVIQGLHAFKVTSLQPSSLFVSEEFVERWHAAGLKGIEFRQVWEG
jgi:hypothetical protein